MSKNRVLFFIVAVACAVCAGLVFIPKRALTQQKPAVDPELANLRGQINALSGSVDVLKRTAQTQGTVVALMAQGAAQAASSAAAPIADQAPASASPPKREISVAEARDYLQDTFSAEDADPKWSRAQATALSSALSESLPPHSQVVNSECRSSICRVETVHENVDTYREFIRAAFMSAKHPLDAGPGMTTLLDSKDGRVRSVSYLARPGHELPRPDDTEVR